MEINNELKNYITKNILPEYEKFDEGHGVAHISDVVNRSLEYYEQLTNSGTQLDINMVYTVACYHDLGMKIERKNHPTHSAELMLADKNLKKWFSNEQIEIMAQAVEDHSTSSQNSPRSIYGKIVCDSDKDRDASIGILRGIKYFFKKNENSSIEDCFEDLHNELVRRFGSADIGGKSLVKFYLGFKKNEAYMKEMTMYAYDKEKFKEKFDELICNMKESK